MADAKLIRGGLVIGPHGSFEADVLIRGSTVATIGTELSEPVACELIDASGCYVLPGGIDTHTHLKMPNGELFTADDYVSGTAAAVCGGTTTVIDFAIQQAGVGPAETIARWRARLDADGAYADVGFHLAVTSLEDPTYLEELAALPAQGITSFKLFMAYPGSLMVGDAEMIAVMRVAAERGALVLVHCENGDLVESLIAQARSNGDLAPVWHAHTRPPAAEAEATHRAIALAHATGCTAYIVHVSCAEALAEVVAGRAAGAAVVAETCPQYLLFTAADLDGPDGARYVFSPPARTHLDQETLWRAIGDGGPLDAVASDHCPFTSAEKALGARDFSLIPNGVGGVEERMLLLHEFGVRRGRMTLERWVELTSSTPARIFGMAGRKGALLPGADADVVIFDPCRERHLTASALRSASDYTVYEGITVTGAPEHVFLRGEQVVRDGALVETARHGAFLARDPIRPVHAADPV